MRGSSVSAAEDPPTEESSASFPLLHATRTTAEKSATEKIRIAPSLSYADKPKLQIEHAGINIA